MEGSEVSWGVPHRSPRSDFLLTWHLQEKSQKADVFTGINDGVPPARQGTRACGFALMPYILGHRSSLLLALHFWVDAHSQAVGERSLLSRSRRPLSQAPKLT